MPEVFLHSLGVALAPSRFISTRLANFPMPCGREEAWRSTPIDRLEGLLADTLDGGVPTYQLVGKPLSLGQSTTLEVATFVLTLHESDIPLVAASFNRVAAAGWNNIREIMRVTVSGHVLQPALLDVHAGEPDSTPMVEHLGIVVREGCDAILVLRHTDSGQLSETVEILAKRHVTLQVLSLQEWEADAKHVATHRPRLAEGFTIQHAAVMLDGDTVRICSGVALPEPHTDISIFRLYLTNAGIHHEQRLFVDYVAAGPKSRVTYKGALQGRDAHAVQVGDVGIGPVACATGSYELNRNLVLGEGPRVDSVPNFKIHNGRIRGAGHVSVTGRLDDEQLFYLMSHGIVPAETKRLVVKALYAELLNQVNVSELVVYVLELVDSRLSEGSLQ